MLPSLRNIMQYTLRSSVTNGDIVVDATAGNGYDTLFLAQLVQKDGHVFSFDVQQQALTQTKKLLGKYLIDNTTLCFSGHEHIATVLQTYNVTSITAAVFNLGYLPRSDKTIITQPHTTITAIQQCLTLLKQEGILCIHTYTGHTGGSEEFNAVLQFCTHISWDIAHVTQYAFINKPSHKEMLFVVEKQ